MRYSAIVIATSALLASHAASAQPAEPDSRSLRRVSVDLVAGMFSRYPGAFSDGGGAVVASTPWWMGGRGSALQFDASWAGYVGVGQSGTAYGAAGVLLGAHLYLGPWLSLEMAMGPAVGGQAGGSGATYTLGLLAKGGYVLHPWKDHRRRFKLTLVMSPQVTPRRDPGNDCPGCYGVFGIGLGYETVY